MTADTPRSNLSSEKDLPNKKDIKEALGDIKKAVETQESPKEQIAVPTASNLWLLKEEITKTEIRNQAEQLKNEISTKPRASEIVEEREEKKERAESQDGVNIKAEEPKRESIIAKFIPQAWEEKLSQAPLFANPLIDALGVTYGLALSMETSVYHGVKTCVDILRSPYDLYQNTRNTQKDTLV